MMLVVAVEFVAAVGVLCGVVEWFEHELADPHALMQDEVVWTDVLEFEGDFAFEAGVDESGCDVDDQPLAC